jgi:hypothetical protein
MDLSANRKRSRHWAEQSSDTKTEREFAGFKLQEALDEAGEYGAVPFDKPVTLSWTLYWPKGTRRTSVDDAGWTSRSRDADACADLLKPWIDAMVDLGWLPNDSLKYVARVSYGGVASSPKGPAMELRIEEMP